MDDKPEKAAPGSENGESIRRFRGSDIYREIRSLVLRGELLPGQHLNHRDLIEQFKVSTALIREALQQLTLEGLLIHIDAKGYFVRPVDEAEILDISEWIEITIRETIHRLAAIPEIPVRVPAPEAQLDDGFAAAGEPDVDPERFAAEWEDWFVRLVSSAWSTFAADFLRYMFDRIHFVTVQTLDTAGHFTATKADLLELEQAIRRRDTVTAITIVERTAARQRQQLPQAIQQIREIGLQAGLSGFISGDTDRLN